MSARQGHGEKLSYYDFEETTVYAALADQRFSYCCYVPRDYDESGTKTYALAVLVHGTERDNVWLRSAFADFANENDCIVLAPLFASGIIERDELSNYKLIKFHDIRYDHILLSMVDELAGKYRVETERFLLYGFSGGGHFTHRMFYLHPERLLGISIGAPGVVTLLDPERDWWVGVRDLETRFGRKLNLSAMRDVAVHMVIGAEDTETWEITITPEDSWWMKDANIAGANRQDRMASLKDSFARHGIPARQDIVPGATHEPAKVIGPVKEFFARTLRAHRDGAAAGSKRATG